jgi:hypothetical protein
MFCTTGTLSFLGVFLFSLGAGALPFAADKADAGIALEVAVLNLTLTRRFRPLVLIEATALHLCHSRVGLQGQSSLETAENPRAPMGK